MKKYSASFCFLFFVLSLTSYNGLSQTDTFSRFNKSSIKGTPGYFRVGKTMEGQWWFITPENEQFFYKGICAVNRAGTQGGRRALPGQYAITVDKKYNYQQSPDSFVEACIEKLHASGFNALGAWATEEFYNKNVPFTEIIEFFKEPPFLPSVTGNQGLPDIFDPSWEVAVDKKARALCSPLRYSKDLVGYFTDNEIGFGNADDFGLDPGFQGGQFHFALLRLVLGMDTGKPAFEYAWNFLLNRHGGSFERLSDAWGVKITSREDVRKLNNAKTIFPGSVYSYDAQAFVQIYAERYFELAYKTIKRYDPNHLILGCRFGGPPPTYVLDAIKPWTDVISANNYQPILYERYDTVYQYSGIPILIGEFSWNTDIFKAIPFPGETLQNLSVKERMFLRGKATLARTAMHEGIVGYTWYRWVAPASTENAFMSGIVNYEDNPDMHVTELQALNSELDQIRMKAVSDNWKIRPIKNGEMTLFFSELKPNWNLYLRMSFKEGKPEIAVNGWKMKGKVLKFSNKQNVIYVKLEVLFEDASGMRNNYEGGKGIYEIKLNRSKEKLYGNFSGTYNGKNMNGTVKAFYFPE